MNGPKLTADEARIAVSKKTAPRVTQESIEGKIASTEYLMHGMTTLCIITMQNGFKVIGSSTPASADNFDKDIGERYAYDNTFKQLWQFEGYLLRQRLFDKQVDGH